MTLAAGSRLGPYEITAKLGEGGMGEVYRASDSKLKRQVAIKVLPAAFTADPERLARFEREAQLLAQLHHPNIAAIFGLEEAAGVRGLVMELVEGEDLAMKMARGPLALEEALAIARQIAEALEAAHEKGIVHRDLKPANVKLTPDGQVKVLDFGLAKALDPTGAATGSGTGPTLMNSPTLTAAGTQLGIILGTAAYMSPEQARGGAVDKRADIWAFGVLLHEMLTGRRLFEGETVSDTLAAVLRAELDWEALPAATPPALRKLLARCLERDRGKRLRDMGDVRLELEDSALLVSAPRLVTRPVLPRWALALGALLLVGLGALAGWSLRRPPPSRAMPSVAAAIPPPPGTAFNLLTIGPGYAVLSPDGTRLAFAAESADQQTRLWVREVASGRLTMLAGSESPQYPFWSPDGRWIAYFTQITGLLRKIPSAGGAPLTLCPAQNGKGGSWNEQDVIVFAPGPGTPIYRISAAGGTPVAATELDAARFNSHRHPRFLPDGRHFLFLARSAAGEGSRVLFGSLDGGPPRDLMRSATQAEWADGHLLFVRDGALLAQAFDPAAGILSGEPMPVADEVIASSNAAVAMFSASSNGLLAFHSGEAEGRAPLEWRDRTGASLGTLGEPADYRNPAFSPDGRQVAFARTPQAGANPDIWIRDLDSGLETRFTLGAGEDIFPTWTADGRSLIYCSNANGPHALYRKSLVGSGEAELLYASSEASFPSSISPDGRWLLFRSSSETGNLDIWLLDVETRQAKPWRAGPAIESWTDFSPDGRWVLYTSDESDRLEIYAVPFPGPGRVLQVSSAGGVLPKWRADGREIIYTNLAGEVIALPVESAGDGLRIGAGTKLFTVPVPNLFDRPIVPTPLADRFLVVPSGVGAARNELNLLVNWTARLPPRRRS